MIDSIQQSSFGEKSASKRSIFQTAAANNLDSEKGSIASQRPGIVWSIGLIKAKLRGKHWAVRSEEYSLMDLPLFDDNFNA